MRTPVETLTLETRGDILAENKEYEPVAAYKAQWARCRSVHYFMADSESRCTFPCLGINGATGFSFDFNRVAHCLHAGRVKCTAGAPGGEYALGDFMSSVGDGGTFTDVYI